MVKNPLLAKTLRILGEKGKEGFYSGTVAEAIVDIIKSTGGCLSLEDLAKHASEITEPTSIQLPTNLASARASATNAAEIELWEHPPNGQGIVAQMALGILHQLDTDGKIPKFTLQDHNSAV